MAMYKYYALIEEDKDEGGYLVSFPDLSNVITEAEELAEAVKNAHYALELVLEGMEDRGHYIAPASPADKIKVPNGASLVLVTVETHVTGEAV